MKELTYKYREYVLYNRVKDLTRYRDAITYLVQKR